MEVGVPDAHGLTWNGWSGVSSEQANLDCRGSGMAMCKHQQLRIWVRWFKW